MEKVKYKHRKKPFSLNAICLNSNLTIRINDDKSLRCNFHTGEKIKKIDKDYIKIMNESSLDLKNNLDAQLLLKTYNKFLTLK